MDILHESLPRRLPIGIQSNMGKPYFLSRPRRFGKSLFLLTLEAFFWGKCELFKGSARSLRCRRRVAEPANGFLKQGIQADSTRFRG